MRIAEVKLPENQFTSEVNTNKIAGRCLSVGCEFFDGDDFTSFLSGRCA